MKVQITYVKVAPPAFRPSPVMYSVLDIPGEVDLTIQDRGGPFLAVRKHLAEKDQSSVSSERSFDVFDATIVE